MTLRRGIALVAVVALLATAAAAWAVVPAKDTYEGRTAQNKSVIVKVNDKHRIKAFLIDYKAKCDSGTNSYTGSVQDNDKQGDRITQHNGVFSGTSNETESAGGNYKGHVKLSYNGEFTAATAANGSAKIKVRVTQAGKTVDHCAKTVKWHVPA
jgi:hypothetical protein